MKNNAQTDWAAVRRAYCSGIYAVARICRQYGIFEAALYYHRKKENWPHRYNLTATRTSRKSQKSKIRRLYQLLDRLIKEIEMEPLKATSPEETSRSGTADRERTARTLSSLIRSFEKIKEIEAEELSATKQTDDEINEADKQQAGELRKILQERFAGRAQTGET